jgi:hypothetical protein
MDLVRRYIIREYDYDKIVKRNSWSSFYRIDGAVFSDITFELLDRKVMEREAIMFALKHPQLQNPFIYGEYPVWTVYNMRHFLYESRYRNWHSSIDSDGAIWIQSRAGNPRTRLGLLSCYDDVKMYA